MENFTGIHGPTVADPLGSESAFSVDPLQVVEEGLDALRPIVPTATYCWLGVMTWNMLLMPVIIAVMSAELMLPVRSATTATSMGLSGIVPHEPLQATEVTAPVDPGWVMPTAGQRRREQVWWRTP